MEAKLNTKPSSCPVPFSVFISLSTPTVDRSVCDLQAEMERHLQDERRGERLRSGVQVVIAGATNAGKSSLLNTLCKRTKKTSTNRSSHITKGLTQNMTNYLLNTDLTVESYRCQLWFGREGKICHAIRSMDSQNFVKCVLFIKMQILCSMHSK